MILKKLFAKKQEIPHCAAVIVAAGSSQRMGEDKTVMSLGGIPVIARTLRAFEKSPFVDEIILVTRMELVVPMADICKEYGISKASKVVCGGKTRMESALAGVSEVKSDASLIAIHDGARPLVSQELIERTVYAAKDYMAAAPAIMSTDTLKAVDKNGFISATVDRNTVLRVQTPQIFQADIIKGALSKAVKDGLTITDDCSAIEMMGVKTKIVDGELENLKLTTPLDVYLAEAILRDRGEKT